jgi:hypothetical protein
MQRESYKEILIQLIASLAGGALSLYALTRLDAPHNFKLFMALVAVGVFGFNTARYGIRYRRLPKKQKV